MLARRKPLHEPTLPAPSAGQDARARPRGDDLAAALNQPLAELLTEGGDHRIALDPATGANPYGCPPVPGARLEFGSSTGSTISEPAFRAVERLRDDLLARAEAGQGAGLYALALDRQRRRLAELCGLSGRPDVAIALSASGTDVHLLAAQIVADRARARGGPPAPLVVFTVEPGETGGGVPAALGGRHFSSRTATGARVTAGETCGLPGARIVRAIAARDPRGVVRPAAAMEAELEPAVAAAVAAGCQVLICVTDLTKTGLLSPGLDGVLALRARWPRAVTLMVDACQFRLGVGALGAYLDHGFLVALTGSKFMGGPAFSGALMIPGGAACPPSPALGLYMSRAEWPDAWPGGEQLPERTNLGLLLRWEAALAEMAAFRAAEPAAHGIVQAFGRQVMRRLDGSSWLELLPTPGPDRRALGAGGDWDALPTLFPFLIRGPGGYLDEAGARVLHRRLSASGVQLGQPVLCGERAGAPVAALRICASARLIAEAAAGAQARARLMAQVATALDAVETAAAAPAI